VTELLRTRRIWYGGAASLGLAMLLAIGLRAQSAGGLILGCISPNGAVRVLVGNDTCRNAETAISWNAIGQQGPPGPTGAQGPAGAVGPAGRDGRDCQVSGPAPPSVIGTMMVTGAPGINSTDTTPIFNISVGATNSATIGGGGGGAGAGKASFTDFVVTKSLDAFSPPLLSASEEGRTLNAVQIDITPANSAIASATYILNDAIVTSDLFSSAAGTGIVENVSFQYAKITTRVTINGSTFSSCFDRRENRSC